MPTVLPHPLIRGRPQELEAEQAVPVGIEDGLLEEPCRAQVAPLVQGSSQVLHAVAAAIPVAEWLPAPGTEDGVGGRCTADQGLPFRERYRREQVEELAMQWRPRNRLHPSL